MNYFLIHGDDSERSYQRLIKFVDEAKKRSWEVVYLDESNLSFSENISGSTLFQSERFFVHRQFKKLQKKEISWLTKKSYSYSGNLVLYSDSEVGKTLLNGLPKGIKIEIFRINKVVWKLLDSFYPGNEKNILLLLHETVKTESIELVFGLLAKQMRDIFWVTVDPGSLDYPSWRIGKLKNLANRFTKEKLQEIISDLSVADVKSKTSNFDLISLIDFIIISKLKS